MAITKYTDSGISPRTNVHAEQEMLRHVIPTVVLEKFGLNKKMPKNKTQTIKFRRPQIFTAATTPLVEGVTPSSTSFSYEDVSGTLRQYGQWVEITDVIQDTAEDPVLNDAAKICGENIGRTMEALDWGVLQAGTSVFYANGSSRAGVNTPISLDKQRKVLRYLKSQKAMPVTEVLKTSMKFGTEPIQRSFIGMAHTDMEADIRNMPGFIPVEKYATGSAICQEELGSVEGVRYVLSPDLDPILAAGSSTLNGMLSAGAANVDVYPVLYVGKEAYARVALREQGAIKPVIVRPDTPSSADPLGQRGSVGWKSWHLCMILNETWMARLECGVTDL